ncbi:MAG: flagellar biosynthesis anti-sigma factor FlgM [Planctomycetota bacterium]|jgi:anti-sigma28 factor (negative regulator of flagellin synthesis)|nr:flagellar biosynthesis anti-sigma factor FlgM [Planctomycetota bacterium]
MVDHINGMNGMGEMRPVRRSRTSYRVNERQIPSDSAEIASDVVRLRGVEGVRMEKVMAIKTQIKAGAYFTEDKFSTALDKALDSLFGES